MSLRCLSGEITALLETLPRVLDDLSPDGRTYCPVNGLWQTQGRTHRERGRHGHAGEFLLTILLTVGLFYLFLTILKPLSPKLSLSANDLRSWLQRQGSAPGTIDLKSL